MSRLLLWPITGKQLSPYIHGRFVKPSSQHTQKLVNPNDKSHLVDVHEASPSQVQEAIVSAKGVSVNSEWQTNPRYRRDCLLALAQRLEQHEHDMAAIESLQTGKPLTDALCEISDVVDCLRFYAGYCDKLYGQSQALHNAHTYTSREPLGTVSLITSFNYPLLLVGWKLGPALAAGNAAIVKPAPQTPLSSLALADLATDILPPGVLSVLPGGVRVAQSLMDGTDKTSFTGSTKVGQEIMRRAADRLLPLTLECGGKNAVIVCDDADLDKAVDAVAMGAFSNAGQNCCAISRAFVHRSIYDAFLNKLAITVQDSWKATLDVQGEHEYNLYGPLIDHNQYSRVLASIQNSNSTPSFTGHISTSTLSRGYFVPPTVFCNVKDDCAPLATQEIFGPVLSVMEPFDCLDDAVRRVNQSVYGLASAVFTQNIKTAHRAANLIKAGFVWCNTYNAMPPSLPFGGRGLSGIGKDLGKSALEQFSFEKSVMIHQDPELGNKEFNACQLLCKYLEKKGFQVTRKIAELETSFLARFSNGSGRRVGFASEYDALPGISHGCGHNLIAIQGLACAVSIKSLMDESLVQGTVVLFGTPAEETTSAIINIVKQGLIKDNVDCALMLHPMAQDALYGRLLAMDNVEIEYFGKPTHATMAPWEGVNAMDAIVQAITSLGLMRQQMLPTDNYLYVHCFNAAGYAAGCQVKLEWREMGPIDYVFTNDAMTAKFKNYMEHEGITYKTRSEEEQLIVASSDFGNVSYTVSAIHPMYAIHTDAGNHTKKFARLKDG
ncbi:hypothetical protein [Parasitella parasitica]|uniref:Aldehyde dehydrogenase domain-containing protein n=1 Tax=Parasitella parasitica TaxID=35722 RepID=A0A0B7MXB2_9FUNG|nr:hypothetical protein [Parasitella parasitica]